MNSRAGEEGYNKFTREKDTNYWKKKVTNIQETILKILCVCVWGVEGCSSATFMIFLNEFVK